MNDADDPLETELASLRPQEPSSDLMQRVGNRLTRSRSAHLRWIVGIASTSGLAAAALGAAFFLREWPGPGVQPGETNVEGQPLRHTKFDDSKPTLLTYQRVLAQSPEALDELLDKHAARAMKPDQLGARPLPSHGSDIHINALTGEP